MKEIKIQQLYVQEIIAKVFNEDIEQDSLIKAAMSYSIIDGGKRLRPILFNSLLASYQKDYKLYYQIAVALEMIHTYSLIHDDLPAMDNDILRHNKPTCHIRFGEDIAILAGDALLSDAFYLISKQTYVDDKTLVSLIREISSCIGSAGMVYGQCLDIQNNTLEETLLQTYHYKTGKLLEASLLAAGLIAQKSSFELEELSLLAKKLGLLYQIQDDLLEVEGDTVLIGKDSSSDLKNNKQTLVSIKGIVESKNMLEQLKSEIVESLVILKLDNTEFERVINYIIQREY